jgi:Trk-type K+ transport system membrane component
VKVLLLPLVIVAFFLFLLILGAIGFAVAFAILASLGRLWRLLSRTGRPRRS